MIRPVTIVGAPSSIGIRPYDDGGVRRLDLAPAALREQGLVERLAARDAGDVVPPAYEDLVRPEGRPRNEAGVAAYSRALADRVSAAAEDGAFMLILGGDCSIVLGCLLGLKRSGRGPVGLVYVDAHADYATPQESRTGSAASMCLALAVGRGDTPLARLDGPIPLVHAEDVVVIGRRDHAEEAIYGEGALRDSGALDLAEDAVRRRGLGNVASVTLERLTRPGMAGFWIHLDADVFDPRVIPAVDSPETGGFGLEEMAQLLTPLVRHPLALGLELTIYDPALDPDRTSAARLASMLDSILCAENRPPLGRS